ncbi:hypothetical protein EYF80_021154 [Liparis tanakae]|uniref:Uncharacterized protein n=1 Tax=Liparis tanakae TaxID=230148 RepID=A0A4Z2HSL1_9TELE|nr:hypothetical protein EYF80_021154 [Liparis tanakae]
MAFALKQNGSEAARRMTAPAGSSEHHPCLHFDGQKDVAGMSREVGELPTSSSDENNTGLRSLRVPGSSLGVQPSLADNRATLRGSMVLW